MLTGIAALGQDPRDTLAAASLPARRRRSTPRRRNTTLVSRRPQPPHEHASVGVPRRLQALAWMGHGPEEIADLVGETTEEVERWMSGSPVEPYIVHVVDRVFESLCMRFGPNHQLAVLARALGWAPPLAWLHFDIDNPAARPHVDIPRNSGRWSHPLESQVMQALWGMQTVRDLIPAEKVRVVSTLHRAGWSDRRIAAYLRWNPDNNINLGRAACEKFRREHGITGGGLDPSLWGGNHGDDDFITIPAAA